MKLKALFLSAAVVLSALPVLPVSAAANTGDIVILYTNDIHCGVDDALGLDGLALYKREMQAQYDNVFLVDAGDAIQGTPTGGMSQGASITKLMNQLGYDAAIPGNHEFDYNMEQFQERAKELECGYICCNLKDLRTGSSMLSPYKLVQAGDVKIGFVGATTPETFHKSTPVYFQNEKGEYIYSFSETGEMLYEAIQTTVDQVREIGADYVILLGHLGEEGSTKKWSSPEVAAHTKGIDAIIDGHSHEQIAEQTVKNSEGKDILISQTGTKLEKIGKMTISADGKIKTELVENVPEPTEAMGFAADSWKKLEDRSGVCVDTSVNSAIAELHNDIDSQLSEKIGHTAFDLYDRDPETKQRLVRNSETGLGNLVADSLRAYTGAQVAFMNGGGLRAPLKTGDITYRDVYTLLPYNNLIDAANVTGKQLLDALEVSARNYPEESGGFPSVSGMTFTIDANVKSSVQMNDNGEFTDVAGEYRVKDVKIGGEPLDLEKTYTLASLNYLLENGGDGYMFGHNCDVYLTTGREDAHVLADYIINTLGGEIPEKYKNYQGEGRITFIPAEEPKPTENAAETTTAETTATSAVTTAAVTAAETTLTQKNIASDEELCKWAVNDYQLKTGKTDVTASLKAVSEQMYEITLTDSKGTVLDVYQINPQTGIGSNSAQTSIDLPQTGNNSMTDWMLVFCAFGLFGLGAAIAASSVVLRRKENEE